MSEVDHIHDLTGNTAFEVSHPRSGVEIHLPGERWVSLKCRVEPALHALVCGKPE